MIAYAIVFLHFFTSDITCQCIGDSRCSEKIKNTTALIYSQGYTPERHQVESEGYLLSLTRIPKKGPPVLLMHGALLASDSWVLRGRNFDLPFLLADLDYDVWLGDARGNSYSRLHRTLSPKDLKFWDFSVHEMGTDDLPAIIDYILETTGQKSIIYIGHSLGTTMMFVMSSMKPEYVYKVKFMIGLAPAAFFRRRIMFPPVTRFVNDILYRIGSREIFPRSDVSEFVAYRFCRPDSLLVGICLFNMNNVIGYGNIRDQSQVNMTLLPEIVSHFPSGLSLKTLLHIFQLGDSGRFSQFDYGKKENLIRYGSSLPPDYDLCKVTTPVLLFYGEDDVLVNKMDVAKLAEALPNMVGNIAIPLKTFNHMDFIWGMDAKELLYDDVIKSIKKYS